MQLQIAATALREVLHGQAERVAVALEFDWCRVPDFLIHFRRRADTGLPFRLLGLATRARIELLHRPPGVLGVSAGSKYRVSVGPKPDIWTNTGSASVLAKWFTPPGSE
jgi:hypothetical protein